jgi:hypothetical protein
MHAHVGSTIKEEMCHVLDHRAALAMYQGVTCGPEAFATAALELVAGEVTFIRFAVGDHPKEGGRIHDIVTVGLAHYGPAKTEVRYIGDDLDVDGAWSFICCPDSGTGVDPVDLAARLTYNLAHRGTWIFRLKTPEKGH